MIQAKRATQGILGLMVMGIQLHEHDLLTGKKSGIPNQLRSKTLV
jgi:hypothetical protein